MSWQERQCNAEGFGRPEPFFFLCEERTYSPPAKQAVVSLPSVRPCALRDGLRSLRRASANAADACGRRSSLPAVPKVVWVNMPQTTSAPCENLPPVALSQLWTMPFRTVHFLLQASKETKNAFLRGDERS